MELVSRIDLTRDQDENHSRFDLVLSNYFIGQIFSTKANSVVKTAALNKLK